MSKGSKGELYWITGLSGAGKTTIGNALYYNFKERKKENVIILDGDVIKEIFCYGREVGYTGSDRKLRAYQYSKLCKLLVDQGMTVICCTIAMFEEVRRWNRENISNYFEIYLKVPLGVLIQRNQKNIYSDQKKGVMNNVAGLDVEIEEPKNPDLILKNDGSISIDECIQAIVTLQVSRGKAANRDKVYWNHYYKNKLAENEPSLFAKFVGERVDKGKELLELGCGNGRDSKYFANLGLCVTAIDGSNIAIKELQQSTETKNARFYCDDFVTAITIYSKQYDYIYSRFSLHAITEMQETELFKNVYNAIKTDGYFFIETRSVKDDIYGKGIEYEKNTFFYNGHLRRFVEKDEIILKLQKIGFEIDYAEENRNFAPYGEENPIILRVIARKPTW